MIKHRPGTKCRRCRHRYDAHDAPELSCPVGGSTWLTHTQRPAQSFNAAEIKFADELLRMVQRGGDPRLLAKVHRKEMTSLTRKVLGMKARAEAFRALKNGRVTR